jgi:hypothetical protein
MWSRFGYSAITSFTSASISFAGKYSFLARPRLSVTPTSQYTQSREHSFFGITSTPSDKPSRRDGTGPNMYFRSFAILSYTIKNTPSRNAVPFIIKQGSHTLLNRQCNIKPYGQKPKRCCCDQARSRSGGMIICCRLHNDIHHCRTERASCI